VRVEIEMTDADTLTLLRHDTDPFNRWQAAQSVAMRLLVQGTRAGTLPEAGAEGFGAALAGFLEGEALADPAFAALVLALPSEADVANEIATEIDPDAIHRARHALRRALGTRLKPQLLALRDALADAPGTPFSPEAAAAGRRAFRNAALDLVAAADPDSATLLAAHQMAAATTMTDRLAALAVLSQVPGPERESALDRFAETYRAEPLVLDKWLAIQAAIPEAETPERIRRLQNHPAFSMTNPNRVRSLIGSFSMGNPTQFNRPDGAGYALVAETVLALDKTNPQVAARLLTAFGSWRMMEPERRGRAESTLLKIRAVAGLSRDVGDILERTLAG
jgi:aminopeptidase N